MTDVRAGAEGSVVALALSGHATGRPDVCAAVSALCCGLAGYLRNAEVRGRAKMLSCSVRPGAVRIRAEVDRAGRGAWEAAVLSLLQLQAAAPEAISVEVNQNSLRFGGENTENQ